MLKLVQNYGVYLGRFKGKDRWEWSVSIHATQDPLELELVEKVTYTLHHTYEAPQRVILSKETGFELIERSTGVFEVKALLAMSAGCPQRISVPLQLFFPSHDEQVIYD